MNISFTCNTRLQDSLGKSSVLGRFRIGANYRENEDYGLVGCDAMFNLQSRRPLYSEDGSTIFLRNFGTYLARPNESTLQNFIIVEALNCRAFPQSVQIESLPTQSSLFITDRAYV